MTCQAEIDGKTCEQMVEDICTSLGFLVQRAKKQNDKHDLVVNGLLVQVKKRTTRKSGCRSIELKTAARHSGIAYQRGDIDVLVLMVDSKWFIVPVAVVTDKEGRVPNLISTSLFTAYRDAWDVMEGMNISVERQLGFDF